MVTIIGNKGSGKSAISDIISMCADGDHSEDYLFLHKTKFKKRGLADRFSASIEFESGEKTVFRQLDHNIDPSEQKRIRYLPQSYFEKVCNEIGKTEAFRIEIEKVVFQYVPLERQLGKTNFQDLISYKKESVEKEIASIRIEVDSLNSKIIDLESKSNPEYIKILKNKKKLKELELQAHRESMPLVVDDPSRFSQDQNVIAKKKELQDWIDKGSSLKDLFSSKKILISKSAVDLEVLNAIKREIQSKFNETELLIKSKLEDANSLGIDLLKITKLHFDSSVLDDKKCEIEANLNLLKSEISSEATLTEENIFEKLNLFWQIDFCAKKINALQAEFSGDELKYKEYLEKNRIWKELESEIIGSEDKLDSLKFVESELQYLNEKLTNDLSDIREKRILATIEIFEKKQEIKKFYDEIKFEIDSRFNSAKVSGLNIVSSLAVKNDFEDELLKNIQQNKSGSFYGKDEGRNLLRNEIISNVNWNEKSNVEKFLREIICYLEFDKRPMNIEPYERTFIDNLVKNRKDFYSYLFSLDYLQSHYDLQQNGKSLEQLSPGEKGALLLVFYLILDKEDIPLIIDQPEDNLDNYSVAQILVPYIKEAKRKRQIIIVTHNPNLAVVSDSEQVIRVSIDKNDGNRFCCVSGGIDEKNINNAVVEVLEGTIPAFKTRKDKYFGNS